MTPRDLSQVCEGVMLELLVVAATLVVEVAVIVLLIRRINEGHALAGRFGEGERDRVIARRARVTVLAAETLLHLTAFAEEAQRAPHVSIRHVDGTCHQWDFASGGTWRVRHRRRVRRGYAGRVVQTISPRRGSVMVAVMSEARRPVRFDVRSASEIARAASSSASPG